MTNRIILIAICILIFTGGTVQAADTRDWNIRFFGVDIKDFEDRKVLPVIIGGLTSFVVHEAGHLLIGRAGGMKTSMKRSDDAFIYVHVDYKDKSDSKKALFHAGGFIAQSAVGTVLTLIPATRHSDFTVGYTSFTAVHNIVYGTTGGFSVDDQYSDINNLNELDYPGSTIAISSGIYSGILTYINLNKQ